MTFKKGGFGDNNDNLKKAHNAKLKKLGRKPRTSKEHEEWRRKQTKTFVLWKSFLDDE